MTIIVANDTPLHVRGFLKRWFLEPKPNVFVGTVNTKTRTKLIKFLQKNTSIALNFLIIASNNSSQGFEIYNLGNTKRKAIKKSGLFLITEKDAKL